MAAVVEAHAGQGARQGKVADEEEQRTPPPPRPVATARRHRQPTPDHPPYCWMINEAIEAMGEDGGLEEDSISAFIRARYPGVPAAHDRLLRHYLAKHVAEGFFVCTTPGRYERVTEENAVMESPVDQAPAEAKRGRGRPRKDGSSSTSPASKKDGSMGTRSTTPKRRAAATADKEGNSSTHKRRRLSRGSLPVAVGSVPTPLVALADKDGSQAASLTPICRGKRRAKAWLATAEDSVPTLPVAVADTKDGSQAASSTPKRRGWLRKLRMATATDNSGGALGAAKKDNREVPYTTDKEHEPPRELALVIVGSGTATTSSAMDKACAEVTPTTPMDVGQPLELALVTTTDVPAPTPTMDNKDGCDAPTFNLALVAKDDGICATPTVLEPSSQACVVQALVAPYHGPVPVSVAGLEEAPSATKKYVLQPRKAGSTPAADKKALSVTTKGRHRECKSAVVSTSDCSALAPVAGKKAGLKVSFASPKLIPVIAGGCPASVPLKSQGRPRKLYPVTADEILRDPGCVLLALPSQMPPPANA